MHFAWREMTQVYLWPRKGQVYLVDGVIASKYALFCLTRRGVYSVFHITLISASPVLGDETHQPHHHNIFQFGLVAFSGVHLLRNCAASHAFDSNQADCPYSLAHIFCLFELMGGRVAAWYRDNWVPDKVCPCHGKQESAGFPKQVSEHFFSRKYGE